MLILSRKVGEGIEIGEGITVTVQAVKGDVVRLAIDAPKAVPILRSELKAAADVNREAANAPLAAISALQKQLGKKE